MNKTVCIEYKKENGKRDIKEIEPISIKSNGEYILAAIENKV